MQVHPTAIPDVLVLEPKVFADPRGFFFESFSERVFQQLTGCQLRFVQDNHSRSGKGVLRGLHYQIQQPQGKLLRVSSGEIFDVAVDLRRSSPTFGQWEGVHLTAENKRMLWIPPGFAHGFVVLSDTTDVLYKATDYYAPQHERTLRWNDPTVAIAWPLKQEPVLSAKDQLGKLLAEAETYP